MAEIGDPEKGHIPLDPNQHLGVAVEDNDKELGMGAQGDDHSEHSERTLSADSIVPPPAQVVQDQIRSKSRSSSVRSRPLSIIPRSKRRGLLGRFAIIPEVERPHDYGNGTKWAITAIVALAAAAAPVGSAIFYRKFSHSYFLRRRLFGSYEAFQCIHISAALDL
jgi:hypothetical protein